MMRRLNRDQAQLFYSFSLEKIVPEDHLVRRIAAVLDLRGVHEMSSLRTIPPLVGHQPLPKARAKARITQNRDATLRPRLLFLSLLCLIPIANRPNLAYGYLIVGSGPTPGAGGREMIALPPKEQGVPSWPRFSSPAQRPISERSPAFERMWTVYTHCGR
jgi:hypothetical protein